MTHDAMLWNERLISTVKQLQWNSSVIWCLKETTSGSFGSRNNCKYEEAQAFWIRTWKRVFHDLYCNDLSLNSILAMVKLCSSQFWSLSFFLHISAFMSYNQNSNQKELKACHRTWSEMLFLLRAIAFISHVAFMRWKWTKLNAWF